MDNKITLYMNTIKYLKPSQIYYRISNRVKRKMYAKKLLKVQIPKDIIIKNNLDLLIPELDFNQEYLDKFDLKNVLEEKFTFINITNQVDLSKAWNNKELQHLWRYNLHYFEYLFKLAYEYSMDNNQGLYYDKFKHLTENWIDNNPLAFGDGWHPYTISLRFTNWISVYKIFRHRIILDHDFDKKLNESIYLQYKYLQNNLEKDVLGNHYFENIKAIIIGSIFFEDIKVKDKFKEELMKQLDEQILNDGMHFELSPMYHKIILEDLIRITYWLRDEPVYKDLIYFIQKMIDVMYSLEGNFGKTPTFNDSADGISKDYKILLGVCKKYFDLSPQHKKSFEDSGFYIINNQYRKLIFDTGDICPSYLPAHGHCDALSFELSINNIPVIVNSGTYKYENGIWRDYFRSTKSHNTVTISNKEQSQFWSSFRVAKRIKSVRRKQFTYKDIQFYVGSYISYHGDEHKRYIAHIDDKKILVLDYVKTEKNDDIESYLHFVPGTNLDIQGNTAHVVCGKEAIKIVTIGTSKIDIELGWYSEQFNVKEENKVLILKKDEHKDYFGYLIDLNSSDFKTLESNNELKIISDKELIINYDELGDML